MPRIEADQIIDLDPWTAFAVSQTTGDTRLRWDPFIKRQRHLDTGSRNLRRKSCAGDV